MERKWLQRIMVGLVAILVPVLLVSSTQALSEPLLRKFANNNIMFYDPEECGSSSLSGRVTILEGKNNAEKIWNWFSSAGIMGVSDNAAVIAGIMGNLQVESGFRPFAMLGRYEDSSSCLGLYQACGGRGQKLREAFRAAGIDESYWNSPNSAPEDVVDTAIDVTLEMMTVGSDSGSFSGFAHALGDVSEDTPQAYSDLFLAMVEIAYGDTREDLRRISSPLIEPAARKYAENTSRHDPDFYQGAKERRNNAVNIYNSYSGDTITNSESMVTRIRSDTQSVVCNTSDYAAGELISGGMTLEQAQQFMQAYHDEALKEAKGTQMFQGARVTDSGCDHGALNNCSAFTQWFLNRYTRLGPTGVDIKQGSAATRDYLAAYPDLIDGGKVPRAYAVVSLGPFTGTAPDGWYNHTGIVLGVDQENNSLIIGEAACSFGYAPRAWSYSLSRWTNNPSPYGPKYAYTDNVLIGIGQPDE